MQRKIGIMGGTFDPIHIGHLILGESAYHQFELEKVIFMPAGYPPHKPVREGGASNEARTEMVRLAIKSNPHFELSTYEMEKKGESYSYETLEHLLSEDSETSLYFIMGADSLKDFDTWKEPARICKAATIVAAVRDHLESSDFLGEMNRIKDKYHADIKMLDSLNIDISSHQIREWVKEGKSLKYYVPDPVIEYIQKYKLYKAIIS